ncbi:hypothetical protein [Lysinibacillus sp. KU-BSD001]|uniref:hypothetical protein n=1 Tax=Lysinibacillus sp. KU-BSD001 TaxID=3141328 RepID=UPI0036F27069
MSKERTAVERVNTYLKEYFQLNYIRHRTGRKAKLYFQLVILFYIHTPSILARFIKVIKVKAEGLEVHYRTSKPSAFYVSTNIKLGIPKNHPNKAYVEKHT